MNEPNGLIKLSLFIGVVLTCFSFLPWHYNLETAEIQAQKEQKYILLNFSGSDWCGPCMRLEKEIFESSPFLTFADTSLIMVNADFPRNKRNQLPKKQQDINNDMADKYNMNGIFPFTLLLNDHGKVLKSWEGLPNLKPEEFVLEIKSIVNRDK